MLEVNRMVDGFISISAYLNGISGLALLIYWYAYAIFLPYRELSTTLVILVKNRNWQWINGLGVLGAAAGYLIAVGAPLFGLGAMFGKYQVYPRSAGVTMMGVGLVWLGLAMLS